MTAGKDGAVIGQRRVYQPGEKPTIYPGEMAFCEAFLTREEMELHARTGFNVDMTGRARVTVTPMPGLFGALLRLRWRLFGAAPMPLVIALLCSAAAFTLLWWWAHVRDGAVDRGVRTLHVPPDFQ